MEEETVPVFVVGPDRFCRFCKRRLVRVHEDGTFDLAAECEVEFAWESVEDGVDAYTADAKCNRIECLRLEAVL